MGAKFVKMACWILGSFDIVPRFSHVCEEEGNPNWPSLPDKVFSSRLVN
jgi:hypothetical protein